MERLLDTRQNVLSLRHQTEIKNIQVFYFKKFIFLSSKAMLQKNQVTPNTFVIKQREIEKWVHKEKKDIQKTKLIFEENWFSFFYFFI
jgi:hypothetical protein